MKKGFLITAATVGALFTGMAVLPWAFQGKIADRIKKEGNQVLNAQFDFGRLDLSFFRNFPQATITLEDFWLKGTGVFVQDTLLQAGEVSATVNLLSLLGDQGFEISKVSISDTRVHALVLPDGQVNWNIMKPDTLSQAEETLPTTSETSFRILLKKFVVDDVDLIYENRQNRMQAEICDLDVECSGDWSADRTLLKLQAESESVTYRMNGIPFLNRVDMGAKMDIDADWVNQKFTLKDNTLRLNALETGIDGWLALDHPGMKMDLKLHTPEVGFKEILSLVPAIYQTDFASLKTAGSVAMEASLKGTLQGDTVPAFHFDLLVKDASFRYPSLPAGVEGIQLHAQATNPGGSLDRTTVSIQPFRFSLAGNPLGLNVQVKTPISDPDFRVDAKGVLDLSLIEQVYPLKEVDLNGKINANLQLAGRLSDLEKNQSHRLVASGTVGLTDLILKQKEGPEVAIQQSLFTFTPHDLQLSETTLTWGQSDFTFDSRFENYLGYVWKGTTLKGNFNIRSKSLYLDELLSATSDETSDETPVEAADEAGTTADSTIAGSSIPQVPRNLDFQMNADFEEVRFKKMHIQQVRGKLRIADGKVDMTHLSMNTLGGSVQMNGSYATTDAKKPMLKGDFQLNQMEFAQAYQELDLVQTMAPIFENLKGNFSGRLNLSTELDQTLSPVLNTTQGSGSLSTRDLSLSGVQVIDRIADAVKRPQLKELTVDDLTLDFLMKDGRIHTEPFKVQMGDYVLNLSGSTGMDQTIDYEGKIQLPESTGKLSSLTTFDLKLGGTFASPTVSLDAKSMVNQAIESIGDKALQKLNEKFGNDSTTTQSDSVTPSKKDKITQKALEFLKKMK